MPLAGQIFPPRRFTQAPAELLFVPLSKAPSVFPVLPVTFAAAGHAEVFGCLQAMPGPGKLCGHVFSGILLLLGFSIESVLRFFSVLQSHKQISLLLPLYLALRCCVWAPIAGTQQHLFSSPPSWLPLAQEFSYFLAAEGGSIAETNSPCFCSNQLSLSSVLSFQRFPEFWNLKARERLLFYLFMLCDSPFLPEVIGREWPSWVKGEYQVCGLERNISRYFRNIVSDISSDRWRDREVTDSTRPHTVSVCKAETKL